MYFVTSAVDILFPSTLRCLNSTPAAVTAAVSAATPLTSEARLSPMCSRITYPCSRPPTTAAYACSGVCGATTLTGTSRASGPIYKEKKRC
jgi:hypothetical protein